ncbi:hypothetical protein LXL04_020965 [Taraxacum kok-saghyz]
MKNLPKTQQEKEADEILGGRKNPAAAKLLGRCASGCAAGETIAGKGCAGGVMQVVGGRSRWSDGLVVQRFSFGSDLHVNLIRTDSYRSNFKESKVLEARIKWNQALRGRKVTKVHNALNEVRSNNKNPIQSKNIGRHLPHPRVVFLVASRLHSCCCTPALQHPSWKGACFYGTEARMDSTKGYDRGLSGGVIYLKTEIRGMSFDELLTIPENDECVYSDGKSTTWVACLHSVFDSIQVTKFNKYKILKYIAIVVCFFTRWAVYSTTNTMDLQDALDGKHTKV